jgi:DNA-directed RNA polymerase specialized sigma24 family protein
MSELTKASLEKLLLNLDEDRDLAAKKYETLHVGLVKFFSWRGCAFPDENADEVMDRVASRLDGGEEIRNVGQYAIGVARLLFFEIEKQRQRQETALRQLPREETSKAPSGQDEAVLEYLRHCLQNLPRQSYQMVIAYYREERGSKIELRKKLAHEMGISSQTFRKRLQRIRSGLEQCVAACLNDGVLPNRHRASAVTKSAIAPQ